MCNLHSSILGCVYVSLSNTHVFVCIPFTCSCRGCLFGCNRWSNWTGSGHCGVLPSADVVSRCNRVVGKAERSAQFQY